MSIGTWIPVAILGLVGLGCVAGMVSNWRGRSPRARMTALQPFRIAIPGVEGFVLPPFGLMLCGGGIPIALAVGGVLPETSLWMAGAVVLAAVVGMVLAIGASVAAKRPIWSPRWAQPFLSPDRLQFALVEAWDRFSRSVGNAAATLPAGGGIDATQARQQVTLTHPAKSSQPFQVSVTGEYWVPPAAWEALGFQGKPSTATAASAEDAAALFVRAIRLTRIDNARINVVVQHAADSPGATAGLQEQADLLRTVPAGIDVQPST